MRQSLAQVLFSLSVALFMACPHGDAQTVVKSCTNASFSGAYGYTISGMLLETSFLRFASAGSITADGNGNLTVYGFTSEGGEIVPAAVFSGTYSLNSDCTGSAVFNDAEVAIHMNMVIGVSGVQLMLSSNGTIISGVAKRRRTACTAEDLRGPYILAFSGWYFDNGGTAREFTESGTGVFDGAGGFSLTDTVSHDGVISNRTISGSYTLSADC